MSPKETSDGCSESLCAKDDASAALAAASRFYLDYLETLGGPATELRVEPGRDYSETEAWFRGTLAEAGGQGMAATVEEFCEEILPRSLATPHPMYFGLVNCSPLPMAPIADLLVSAINNNGGARHQSPSAYAAEAEVVREFSRLCFDDPELARGLILPGGSYANLQALLLARQAHFPEWREHGPSAVSGAPRIYGVAGSHFSISRSAEVGGLGRAGFRPIKSHGRGQMQVDDLARQIAEDKARGDRPFLVMATAGSTGTGAIDPLAEIAALCRREGLWFHVDACYGGAAQLLASRPEGFSGLHRADSVAVDPHKWFYMPVTSALFLCRHARADSEAFDFAASYIPNAAPEDAYRRSIPSSRRASALTVWMALRAHGWAPLRAAVTRNIELTRRLEAGLLRAGFAILEGGELSIANARWQPPGRDDASLDELQVALAQQCVATGRTWFATVRHGGRTWLRFNIVNLHTRASHIDELVELVHGVARAL